MENECKSEPRLINLPITEGGNQEYSTADLATSPKRRAVSLERKKMVLPPVEEERNSGATAQTTVGPVIYSENDYHLRLADYNPGADKIPHDFLSFNPTELEHPTRGLFRAEDTWAYVPSSACKNWRRTVAESE